MRQEINKFYRVSLHKEPPEVGLVEKLTERLHWWVELLCVPILHRECSQSVIICMIATFPSTDV